MIAVAAAATSPANSRLQAAVAVEGISKSFGATRALDRVSVAFRAGEIHALLGQNGAGKSTLFKVLAGVCEPDAGRITVGSEHSVDHGLVPRRSQELGFRFVHQDLALVDTMSVAENVCVQQFMTSWAKLHIRWRDQERLVAKLLDSLGFDLPPSTILKSLAQSEKATVAIARALYSPDGSRPRLLVLDEPTAYLPISERARLFAAMRRAAQLGAAVVFSTHRLDEVLEVSQRISVLRDGRMVWSDSRDQVRDESDLIARILGQALERFYPKRLDSSGADGDRLQVRGLCGAGVNEVGFAARRGEIVGLTGLVGAGHDAVPYLLIGATRADAGEIRIDGEVIHSLDPRGRTRAGFGLLAADRTRDSGIVSMTVRENLTMTTLTRFARRGTISRCREQRTTQQMIERFEVRPQHSSEMPLGSLSGGNQQKLLLARSLMRTDLRCLILHEPTQGVDVKAKQTLLRQIAEAAQRGITVLLVSTDNDDLSHLCDRVLVMRHGRIRSELHRPDPGRIAEQCLSSQ